MCDPQYFALLNYTINPWMQPGTIDKAQSTKQWNDLVTYYKMLGIDVEIIEQQADVPDMVFATDQGIVHEKDVLLSRFWHKERQRESNYYEQWFRDHGYMVHHLPKNVYFEGNGNAYFWNDLIFIGLGYRADKTTYEAISRIFNREVIPLHIVNPAFYHLDMGFLPLNNETAFYYPHAFSERSRETLKKKIPNLLELTKEEAEGFVANSVVTDHHVIHQKGNLTFKKKLADLGYKSVEIDLSEFKKSGGGAHCLTNILEIN